MAGSATVRVRDLNLRAGDEVIVRSREEILATLDERGCFEDVPFMPEMVSFCGQRMRVFKRADKTCDNIEPWNMRRVTQTVHLENARCDGAGHDGCQAGCMIFWKEAWLKRAGDPGSELVQIGEERAGKSALDIRIEDLLASAARNTSGKQPTYFCQATEVRNFSTTLAWWDLRQYVRDLQSRNLASGYTRNTKPERVLDWVFGVGRILRALTISAAGAFGYSYPYINSANVKTVPGKLDLQPGEFVQVRSCEEIEATLDSQHKNRGLLFDSEMVPYCGGTYRVLRRVNKIVDEKTGKMLQMKYPCIVLEGVFCKADFHRLCPRAIFSYWREDWLKRVSPIPEPSYSEQECSPVASGCR
jgi:hypothetical protein